MSRSRGAKSASSDGFVSVLEYEGGSTQSQTFPMWLLLTGILLIPASLNIHLSGDGLKFTPGRAAITLLLLPSLFMLFRPSRHFIASDLFIFLASTWMVGSRLPYDGLNQSAAAAALELFGGYFVGRAYFYGPRALKDFLRIFKIVIFLVISIAVLDPLLGQNVVQAAVSIITQTPVPIANQERFGIVRAASTIEMAELYGMVCCVAGSIFLFLESSKSARYFWAGFSFFGCILSLSSGPILAFAIVVSTYVYDLLLCRYSWRWKLVTAMLALFLLILSIVTQRPVSWILSHLTLDSSTGYFRMYVFQYIFEQINASPLVGYGFGSVGDDEFLSNVTVDCVWLVNAMRYGIPMVALFFLANLTAYTSLVSRGRRRSADPFVAKAATGFTQAMIAFMLVGITVHFWNATWMFWAVCIGIRGSIKEWQRHGSPVSVNHSLLPLSPPRLAHGWRARPGRDQRYWPAATPEPDARE
jgi:hypothetical protein